VEQTWYRTRYRYRHHQPLWPPVAIHNRSFNNGSHINNMAIKQQHPASCNSWLQLPNKLLILVSKRTPDEAKASIFGPHGSCLLMRFPSSSALNCFGVFVILNERIKHLSFLKYPIAIGKLSVLLSVGAE